MLTIAMVREPDVAGGVAHRFGSAALRGTLLALAGAALACSSGADNASQRAGADNVAAGGAGAGGSQATGAEGPAPGSGADAGPEGSAGVGGTASTDGPAGTGATAGTAGTGGPAGTDAGATAPNIACDPIVDGPSTLLVDSITRTFSVRLPADTSEMALLFIWHGFAQDPATFSNEVVYDVPAGRWVPFDPNAFPMPLMIVTPTSTNLAPPAGLAWDISSGAADLPFFEGMLQCIKEQFNVDETRIYSFGFSAGAVFTNLLSATYPQLFAATISESGAWFNDMAQWSDVLIPLVTWTWPAFDPADRGNVLLTHGGRNDFATVISLESANQKALPFLHSNGRTVTECTHTFGHTLDPDLTQRMYYDYMWSHQLGGPPLSGLVAGFPTQASPVGATHCTFHPAP